MKAILRTSVVTAFAAALIVMATSAQAQTGAPACAQGEAIQVHWGSSWYEATIESGPDAQGRCHISYNGWSSSWNEWVGPDRMRGYSAHIDRCPTGAQLEIPWLAGKPYTATIVNGPNEVGACLIEYQGWGRSWFEWGVVEVLEPPTLLCNPGQPIRVEWNGTWYDSTAVSGSDDACLITYDGWSSSWDEVVGPSRMMPR